MHTEYGVRGATLLLLPGVTVESVARPLAHEGDCPTLSKRPQERCSQWQLYCCWKGLLLEWAVPVHCDGRLLAATLSSLS